MFTTQEKKLLEALLAQQLTAVVCGSKGGKEKLAASITQKLQLVVEGTCGGCGSTGTLVKYRAPGTTYCTLCAIITEEE